MPRRLLALDPGAGVEERLDRVGAALGGHGPALLTVPAEPVLAARVLAAMRPDDPSAPLESDDVALVVPTSGSTGEPRGAMLTAAALTASATATADRLGGPATWLLAVPTSAVAGLQVLVRSALAGTVPQAVDLAGGFRPEAFVRATEVLVATTPGRRAVSLVPTQLVRLLDARGLLGREVAGALASFDAVLLGGAPAPAPLLARAAGFGARVVTTYGMSETCGGCVYDGVPLEGVEVATEDDGRVRLGGPTVFSGYRLDPVATAQTLVDGWVRTSDVGRLHEDGRLQVLGRADEVLLTGGTNVAAPAVAEVLATHPGVAAAHVHARDDREWGQRLVAAVVPRDPARPPALADLREHVARALGRAAAPRGLVVVDALPLLEGGKVDRRALAALGEDERA